MTNPWLRALAAAPLLATFAFYACGGGSTSSGTTSGSGGGATTSHTGTGGAAAMTCPTTPPSNEDSCAGFAVGQQCNYGSSGTGTLSSTECQCTGGQTWSCGTEASGTGD